MRGFDWRPHLQDDESLIWQGSPYPALRLIAPSQAEWLIGGLGLVAVLMLLILRHAAGDAGASGSVLLATVVLMLVALGALGWPVRGMRQRSRAMQRQFYAVTDRRVLTVADGRDPRSVAAANLPPDPQPVVEPDGIGLGTLRLGGKTPALPYLRNADEVARLIRAVLAQLREGAA